MTATELILMAYERTQLPIEYHTRDENGQDKTTRPVFVEPRDTPHFDPEVDGECIVCGAHFCGGISGTKFFSSSYTDGSIHKNPTGTHVCRACAWCMSSNAEASRTSLCRYSFVASGDGLKLCNRAELRDELFCPPEPPFVAVASVSQKKHLATKAAVSYSRERFYCMLEEERISVELSEFCEEIEFIEALRGVGATKDEIRQCVFRYDNFKKWGWEKSEEFVARAFRYSQKRMFGLALFVAQKKEEEEARCILGLKQTT